MKVKICKKMRNRHGYFLSLDTKLRDVFGEVFVNTVNSEIIAFIYYCNFVNLNLNAILNFTILRKVLLTSDKI